MHWNLWGVSHLGQEKVAKCNQNLGHVADRKYVSIVDLRIRKKMLLKLTRMLFEFFHNTQICIQNALVNFAI